MENELLRELLTSYRVRKMGMPFVGYDSIPKAFESLSGHDKIAWDRNLIYCIKDGKFIPFSRIPSMPACDSENIANVAFIMECAVEAIENTLNGKPLSDNPVEYTYKGVSEPDHVFSNPGIVIDEDYYKLIPDINGKIILSDKYKLSEKISTKAELMEEYDKAVATYHNSLKDKYRNSIRKFNAKRQRISRYRQNNGLPLLSHDMKLIFYEKDLWTLLYDPKYTDCSIRLACPPYILEDINNIFYAIEPSIIGFEIPIWKSADLVSSLKAGYQGMTPMLISPENFSHPFVSSYNCICTQGFAEEELQSPNLFSGIVSALLGTRRILRCGYGDYRNNTERRFTPFTHLCELNGLKKFRSLSEAKSFGLPIYRYFIEDRADI